MPRRRGRPRKESGGGAARGRGARGARGARGGASCKPQNEGRSGKRVVKYKYTEEQLLAAWYEFHR